MDEAPELCLVDLVLPAQVAEHLVTGLPGPGIAYLVRELSGTVPWFRPC
jgi:hypothetical protein